MDGRKGYAQGGPYDVIHLGGAIEEISQEIYDQMAKGGRMWAPVGKQDKGQSIYVIDKDLNGQIKETKVMDVRYGSLQSVESQLGQE